MESMQKYVKENQNIPSFAWYTKVCKICFFLQIKFTPNHRVKMRKRPQLKKQIVLSLTWLSFVVHFLGP